MLQTSQISRDDPFYKLVRTFGEENAIELGTRMMVMKRFKRALRGRLEAGLLSDLKKTFFEFV
jgi:hypothetical protein